MDFLSEHLWLAWDSFLFGFATVITSVSSSVDVPDSRDWAELVRLDKVDVFEDTEDISGGIVFAVSFADCINRSRFSLAHSRAFLSAMTPSRNE